MLAGALAGHAKTIEFTFDLEEDTAECIANEMMQELNLSEEEATEISEKINDAINRISSSASASASASRSASSIGSRSPGSNGSLVSVSPSASVSSEVDQLAAAVAELANGHAKEQRREAAGGGATTSGRSSLEKQQQDQQQQQQQGGELQRSSAAGHGYGGPGSASGQQSRPLSSSSSFAERSPTDQRSQSGATMPPNRPTSYHDLVKVMTAHFDANGNQPPARQSVDLAKLETADAATLAASPAGKANQSGGSRPAAEAADGSPAAEEDDLPHALPMKA
jgi:hypothetical protein